MDGIGAAEEGCVVQMRAVLSIHHQNNDELIDDGSLHITWHPEQTGLISNAQKLSLMWRKMLSKPAKTLR